VCGGEMVVMALVPKVCGWLKQNAGLVLLHKLFQILKPAPAEQASHLKNARRVSWI
jgi:hypothetical protein